jgi:hypothetical protein
MEVVEFNNRNGAHVDKVVQDTLELSDTGEILNIAVIVLTRDGKVHDVMANNNEVFKMIGALEVIKSDTIENCLESIPDE